MCYHKQDNLDTSDCPDKLDKTLERHNVACLPLSIRGKINIQQMYALKKNVLQASQNE